MCRIWLIPLSLCLLATSPALADGGASEKAKSPSAWTFDAGLYGWALWVQGDVTTRDLTFDVYADPIDLIEHLDGPIIMGNFEAKNGRFSFYADVVYAKFHLDSDFLGEARPIPALKLTGDARIDADYEFGVYQADIFYQVARLAGANGGTTIELGGGARWVREELDVTAAIDLTATIDLQKRLKGIERRIRRIENQEDRLASLARLNALRAALLNKRIIQAEDRGLQRLVNRLENRLQNVQRRGDAIAALEAIERFRLALLRAALNLNGREFNRDLAFVNGGVTEWVDPVIAMRVTHQLGNGQSVTAMGDVGGFDTESDFSWQVVLTFDKNCTLLGFDTTASVGYKALGLLFNESTSKGTQGQDSFCTGRWPS